MSRRQTLGVLSPSQLNAGQQRPAGPSAAAQRINSTKENQQPAGAAAARGRKSLAPGFAEPSKPAGSQQQPVGGGASLDHRRSSVVGGKASSASGPKADPRPLSDKGFLTNAARNVFKYLSTHGYPAAVAADKLLAGPSAKDFTQIVQFLIQQFDPNIKTFGKIEDDVPLFFKRLSYPFQISKSALFAVGAPHTWPAVLAALNWLVELLTYNERTEEQASSSSTTRVGAPMPGTLEDPDAVIKREFFEHVRSSYQYWLARNDNMVQILEQEVEGRFMRKRAEMQEMHDRLKQDTAKLGEELQVLASAPSPLIAAQERRAERAADTGKFEKLIENLVAMKAASQRKLAERQADLEAKQAALAEAQRMNEGLRARIAAQPVNKADLHRMVMERSKQKEVLEAVSAQAEELQRKVDEQEMQLVAKLKSLETTAVQYNQSVHRLKLAPASAKRADGVTYELRLNSSAATPGELASVDLKGIVRPGLERLCETYRTRAAQLGRDLVGLREAAAGGVDALAERRDEVAALEAQISKLESQLRAAREAQDVRIRDVSGRADRVADEVEGLKSAASTRLAEVEARKAAALSELETLTRSCEAEISQLRADLNTALDMVLQHRVYIDGRLRAVTAAVQETHKELAAMPVPARSSKS